MQKDQKHLGINQYYQTSPHFISFFIFFFSHTYTLPLNNQTVSTKPSLSRFLSRFLSQIFSGKSWWKVQVFTSISARKPEVKSIQTKQNLFYLLCFFFLFIIYSVADFFFFFFFFEFSDLLYKDYQSDHKFTVTTYTSTGVVSFFFFFFFLFLILILILFIWLLNIDFMKLRFQSFMAFFFLIKI